VELLKQNISWNFLLEMGAWHGVVPMLAKRLTRHPGVPSDVAESLRAFALTNAARNLSLSVELTKLSTALTSYRIPVIAYKGTVLSHYLFASAASRSVYDIDLIVRPEDLLKTVACLEGLGFEDGFGLTAYQRTNTMRYGFEHSFVRGETAVDLHWRVVPHFVWPSLDAEELWSSLVTFPFMGNELRIFSPEWMLAVLCIHAAQHDWMHLKMFADIAQLLSQHPSLDWRVIEGLTADSHSRRSLLVALNLTHTYLGATLPAQASEAIDMDPQVRQIASRVYLDFWPCKKDPTPAHMDFRWLLFRTKGERWIDRWRYIGSLAFRPTMADFLSLELPNALAWLYFAVRPLRIISARMRR
jgi:hypothetical protein